MWNLFRQKNTRLRTYSTAKMLAEFTPAFKSYIPDIRTSPIVLASPHSGRHYPRSFTRQTRLPTAKLRTVEDGYIDQIFDLESARDFAAICALFPRTLVDVNRSADELPPYILHELRHDGPFVISPRARVGLGVIPTRINMDQDIYRHSLSADEVSQRLDHLYHPYHNALRSLLAETREKFGQAILIDCHSMPGVDTHGNRRSDIILGDFYGQSCQPHTTQMIESILSSLGYDVSRNDPYAGGYTTQHYGQPDTGIEVIQIEINRDLYLDTTNFTPNTNFDTLAHDMQHMVQQLIQNFACITPIAAQ
jgi:N-formylglutamate amidohydrolase